VSFSFAVSFPQEIPHQDRLGTTIANSMDLRHAGFCPCSERTSFFQSRLLLSADRFQGSSLLLLPQAALPEWKPAC
jgi:hypothetical protein